MQATCKRKTALTQKNSELQTWLLCCPEDVGAAEVILYEVSVQEMLEIRKEILFVPGEGKEKHAFKNSHLLLETLESWRGPL